MQASRGVERSGTNRTCGLACFPTSSRSGGPLRRPSSLKAARSFRANPALFAGGHREAAIPVPIPNTEVKRPFAEGSAGPARARVGRRRLFFPFGGACPPAGQPGSHTPSPFPPGRPALFIPFFRASAPNLTNGRVWQHFTLSCEGIDDRAKCLFGNQYPYLAFREVERQNGACPQDLSADCVTHLIG